MGYNALKFQAPTTTGDGAWAGIPSCGDTAVALSVSGSSEHAQGRAMGSPTSLLDEIIGESTAQLARQFEVPLPQAASNS